MADYDIPLIDEDNPLYCPSVPAVSFLESIRRQLQDKTALSRENTPELDPDHDDSLLLPSFARLLDKSVTDDDLLELAYNPGLSDTLLDEDSGDTSISSVLQGLTFRGLTVPLPPRIAGRDSLIQPDSPPSFSELQGPARRKVSFSSINDGSFELSGKAEPIRYFARGSSPCEAHMRRVPAASERGIGWKAKAHELQETMKTLEDEVYGTAVGTETPRGMATLISRLDNLLPGIRLTDVLSAAVSHQDLVDILCANGFMNARVLNAFRTSEIEYIDLAASLADESGLNMDAKDLLQALAKPNSFLFLHEINLSRSALRDSDIIRLHHLPRLARLWLQATGITNEAIFLLIPLKRCLQELDVADNPDIDDDVVVAFDMLSRLLYLKFSGTNVTIAGLRRFVKSLQKRGHTMDLEIPESCVEHLRQLHLKYIPHPAPPLITDPKAVNSLTSAAIAHNLAAHAAANPNAPSDGTTPLLARQLEELLENRKADLYARELIGLD